MDKRPILAALREKLLAELEVIRASVASAVEGATHEEVKAENEYDTRGLEASYLAGAQAARGETLLATIEALKAFAPPSFGEDAQIALGACVVVVDEDDNERRYFISEIGGGTKVDVGSERWWVLSPSSPLAKLLIGKREGDVFEHVVRGEGTELEITKVA